MNFRKISISILFFLFLSSSTHSQDSPSDFINNKCYHKIDGTGKSLGIKAQFSIPCSWDSVKEDRPNLVRGYEFKPNDNSAIGFMFIVDKFSKGPSKKEIDSIYTIKGAQQFFGEIGKVINVRKVNINGNKWGELLVKSVIELPQGTAYQYILLYLYFFENHVIEIGYKAGAFSEDEAKGLYDKYEIMFKTLASGVIVYNILNK